MKTPCEARFALSFVFILFQNAPIHSIMEFEHGVNEEVILSGDFVVWASRLCVVGIVIGFQGVRAFRGGFLF